jgi:NADH-quinone oxidoreductase subunit D
VAGLARQRLRRSTILIYTFREREDLFDMYEAVSGARMHAAYFRPGGVYRDLPDAMPQYKASKVRTTRSLAAINETARARCWTSSTTSRSVSQAGGRVRNPADRQPHLEAAPGRHRRGHARARAQPGLHRPMLRGSGIAWDLRKKQPYEVYDQLDFDIPVGKTGDCYDRYLVRGGNAPVQPHHQAVRGLAACQPGPGDHRQPQGGPAQARAHEVQHGRADPPLQAVHRRLHVPEGEAYAAVEHPKGEFGIYLVSDGANKPYRLKIRRPDLPTWPRSTKWPRPHAGRRRGHHRHLDIVFGEIDR